MPDRAASDAAVSTLLLHAGRLMEDASVDAATSLPHDPTAAAARVAALAAAGAEIAALTAAAGVLQRRPDAQSWLTLIG